MEIKEAAEILKAMAKRLLAKNPDSREAYALFAGADALEGRTPGYSFEEDQKRRKKKAQEPAMGYKKGQHVLFRDMKEPWKITDVDENDVEYPVRIKCGEYQFWAAPNEIHEYVEPIILRNRKKRGEKKAKIDSHRKGKEGELELASVLRDYGFNARRGVQYCGKTGAADVVGVPGLHIECKRNENLNIYSAIDQSTTDAQEKEIPVVFFRKNHRPWMAALTLDNFIKIWIKADLLGRNPK